MYIFLFEDISFLCANLRKKFENIFIVIFVITFFDSIFIFLVLLKNYIPVKLHILFVIYHTNALSDIRIDVHICDLQTFECHDAVCRLVKKQISIQLLLPSWLFLSFLCWKTSRKTRKTTKIAANLNVSFSNFC